MEQLLRFVQKPQGRSRNKLWSQKWSGWSNRTSVHLFSNSKDPRQSGKKRLTRPTYWRCPKPGGTSQLGSCMTLSLSPASCVWSIALKKAANSAVSWTQGCSTSCLVARQVWYRCDTATTPGWSPGGTKEGGNQRPPINGIATDLFGCWLDGEVSLNTWEGMEHKSIPRQAAQVPSRDQPFCGQMLSHDPLQTK